MGRSRAGIFYRRVQWCQQILILFLKSHLGNLGLLLSGSTPHQTNLHLVVKLVHLVAVFSHLSSEHFHVFNVDETICQFSFHVFQRMFQQLAALKYFRCGFSAATVHAAQHGEKFVEILLTHVPKTFVKWQFFLILLFVACVEDGTVEFAVRDSGRWERHGEIGGETSIDDRRLRVIGERHQQSHVLLDVLTENGENGIDGVALGGRQSTVTGSGHKTGDVNLVNSILLLRKKLLNISRDFLALLAPFVPP